MNALQSLLTHGAGSHDASLLAVRLCVGGLFSVSGGHKLFNPTRRQDQLRTFAADGVSFAPMIYVVPLGELLGGLGVAFGVLSFFAALGLAVLCAAAFALDGRKRIPSMRPLDAADRIDNALYLPEVLYIFCLLPVLSFGPGAYSLDALVWR